MVLDKYKKCMLKDFSGVWNGATSSVGDDFWIMIRPKRCRIS